MGQAMEDKTASMTAAVVAEEVEVVAEAGMSGIMSFYKRKRFEEK